MYAVKILPCCLSLGHSFYSFHLHFQTVGRYRISHRCPNPSLCQSRPQKQRSHRTASPLSTTLVFLVTEVHWASLELSETQPQHSCQMVFLHMFSHPQEDVKRHQKFVTDVEHACGAKYNSDNKHCQCNG